MVHLDARCVEGHLQAVLILECFELSIVEEFGTDDVEVEFAHVVASSECETGSQTKRFVASSGHSKDDA